MRAVGFPNRHSYGRRPVTENHLYAFRAVWSRLQERLHCFTKLREARVGSQELLAALCAFDAIQIGGEAQGAPAHLKKLLLQDCRSVCHIY